MTVKFVVKYEWKGGENRLYYTIEAHLPNPIPSLLHNNKNIILGKFNIENENSGVEIDGERVFTLKQSEFYCSTNEPEEIFTKTHEIVDGIIEDTVANLRTTIKRNRKLIELCRDEIVRKYSI